MRFLANENFPGDAVTQLKAAGHDIVWVRVAAPGIKDEDVLAWAAQEARIVLTLTGQPEFPKARRGRVSCRRNCFRRMSEGDFSR
jgi:hypothetical protein